MSRRPLIILCVAILALSVCTPLGAQSVGVGFQIARSNQVYMLESMGPALRVKVTVPVDFRYDYLVAETERVENTCGGNPPPNCGFDSFAWSTHVHSAFIAARARLVTLGSFQLFALPEAGFVIGWFSRRSLTTGSEYTYTGGAPGAGVALELSAPQVGGTLIGGWIAARVRGFVHPGTVAVDGYDPIRGLDWIRAVELGLTVAVR